MNLLLNLVDRNGQHKDNPLKIVPSGTQAFEFELQEQDGQTIRLRDFRGQPVILAFYPADWSPVCGDQMSLYNQVLPLFQEYDAVLLGISVDSRWSHKAFREARNLKFPLLSDFEPKGAVAQQYGAYDPEKGTAARALFVIDANGAIAWSYLSPTNVNPGADGILRALEQLSNQGIGKPA